MGHSRNAVILLKGRRAQAVIEFTFAMILVLLMVYALMSIFRWNGVSLAERRIAHENALIAPIVEGFQDTQNALGPQKQIDPYFYKPKKVRAVWGE